MNTTSGRRADPVDGQSRSVSFFCLVQPGYCYSHRIPRTCHSQCRGKSAGWRTELSGTRSHDLAAATKPGTISASWVLTFPMLLHSRGPATEKVDG